MSHKVCVVCLVLTWIMSVETVSTDDSPYCGIRFRRLCQGKGVHVACQFPFEGPSENCSNYTAIIFTSDLKHYITNYLNRRRQRIATGQEKLRGGSTLPRPQVMMFVEWDRELAFLAQRLADQCRFVHDDCRATVRYPYAGQTVGEVRWRRFSDSEEMSAQRAIRRVLDAWWGERRRAEPRHLIQPFRLSNKGTVWGHFSQLAVWNLRGVGCGAARHGADYPKMLLVCDFSHTNMLGQKTINPGPLIACPERTARRSRSPYPLLCAPIRIASSTNRNIYTKEDENTAETSAKFLSRVNKDVKVNGEMQIHDETQKKTDKVRMQDEAERESLEKMKVVQKWQSYNDKRLATERRVEWKNTPTMLVNEIDANTEADDIPAADVRKLEADDDVAEDNYTEIQTLSRQKWKPARNRPPRPGAGALLNKQKQTNRESLGRSLTLDKDDLDQLYQDTGFKVDWKNKEDTK